LRCSETSRFWALFVAILSVLGLIHFKHHKFALSTQRKIIAELILARTQRIAVAIDEILRLTWISKRRNATLIFGIKLFAHKIKSQSLIQPNKEIKT